MDIFTKILTDFGPWVGLCAALLWGIKCLVAQQRDDSAKLAETQTKANRETVKRLQETEDWVRGTLVAVLGDVTRVMSDLVQSNCDTQRTNREILQALRGHPCMQHANLPNASPSTDPLIRKARPHG